MGFDTLAAPGGLRIGITLGLTQPHETVWNNGIKQNAVYLAETLKHVPGVGSVHLVHMGPPDLARTVRWDTSRWPTAAFGEVKDALDILIELGGQVSHQETAYLKSRGVWLVSYCCGVEYIHAAQSVLFDRQSVGAGLFVNQRYDAIWMVPQVANLSEAYFTTLRRRPARVAPFVWDPVFLRERSGAYAHEGEYRPRPGPRRLTVMEPNIDIVKFCLYPVFIAEEAYRLRPDLVSFLHVANADRLATASPAFIALMTQLDIVRQHKASFVGRFDTPQFLAEMTDVVISHQLENPLNYFYFDVCWQGYPLVHNAHMCKDLGYFYPGQDVQAGATQLLHAMQAHDAHWQGYRDRQRAFISRHLPTAPAVLASYHALLQDLMQQAPR